MSVRCARRVRVLAAAGAGIALLAVLAWGWLGAPVLATAGTAGQGKSGGGDMTAGSDMAAGVAFLERGMFEEAVAAFSRVVAADPKGPEAARAFDYLGYLYWGRGWNEEALGAFRESLRCAGEAGDAAGVLRARVALGQVLLDMGKMQDACREFEQAIDVAGPGDLDIVYTLLGIAKSEGKDSAGAAEMFSRALAAFPGNPVAESHLKKLSFGMPIHFASVEKALPGSGESLRAGTGTGTGTGTSSGAGAGAAGGTGAGRSEEARLISGVVFVNEGATYATTPHVRLTLGVDQPVAVKGFFLAAGDEVFRWHDWRSPIIEWKLRGEGDGKKPIRVAYYVAGTPGAPGASGTTAAPGGAGGAVAGAGPAILVAPAEASIVLDREPPRGSVEINDGARSTNSTRVTLDLRANDRTSGIMNVSMSNDGVAWSRWTMYQFTKDWEIPSGDGEKKVYVRFQDRAGNTSTPVSDRIVLDTVPPEILWVDVAKLAATTADIVWATDEDSDSAVEYAAKKARDGESMVARDRDMTMLHHVRLKDLQPSTTYRFRVFSRDEAGNTATSRVLEFATKPAT
ncbi:MAG: tetratricopeptide repeat protein [Bacillota bacterium]|nr:tetratricopeptide repeat protein [Bacillota bacterium]